jgi:hypothetical protein
LILAHISSITANSRQLSGQLISMNRIQDVVAPNPLVCSFQVGLAEEEDKRIMKISKRPYARVRVGASESDILKNCNAIVASKFPASGKDKEVNMVMILDTVTVWLFLQARNVTLE